MTAPLSPAPALTAEEAARVAVFDAAEEPEEVTVEKVSRAIWDGMRDETELPWESLPEQYKPGWRRMATAALTAMQATR